MVDAGGPALGLSIGATNLAAATADNAITRKPVLTLYGDGASEVGVPAENPRLDRPGLVVGGFVNRVGDPRDVVASDGSVHRSEALLADALRALAYVATRGRPLPDKVAVTYPAHWTSAAVDALGAALSEVPEWSGRAQPLLLIPDAAAALLAVRANRGLPPRGTVAVCDFGGTGTNITLMSAGGDYQALAPTVRFAEFSGDLIDQSLLSVVVANMPSTGSFEASGSAAIGSLSRLRAGCRGAKERLSASTATALTDGLTGTSNATRLTRGELDDAIRPALQRCLAVLEDTLARNGIQDLVTVVSMGGGANLPAVTTALARHFRVPVATTPRPQLTAAIGAALRVANGVGTIGDPGAAPATLSAAAAPATNTARAASNTARAASATLSAPPAPLSRPAPPAPATARAPWPGSRSRPQATPETARATAETARATPETARATPETARATPEVTEAPQPAADEGVTTTIDAPAKRRFSLRPRWHRPPAIAIACAVAVLVLLGIVAVIGLTGLPGGGKSATTPAPGVNTTRPAPAPATSATAQPASPTPEVPVPTTSDSEPSIATEQPTTTTPPATPQAAPPAAGVPAHPRRAAPQLPVINEPIPGLDKVNQIIQEIEGGLGIGGIPPLPGQ